MGGDKHMTSLTERVWAWYFVLVWGSAFLATKAGLQYTAPFTLLCLRFVLALAVLLPIVAWYRPEWPRQRQLLHVCVAGLLIHAVNFSGSHYAQYLGMSAGVTALVLSLQPLLTALIATRWLRESLRRRQWLGIALGLAGVALVVWHKIDVRAVSGLTLTAVLVALVSITLGTLYQRAFCKGVDLNAAAVIQFAISLIVVAPFAWGVEGMRVQWNAALVAALLFLVILSSILAMNVLHVLMRRGQATRVTSMIYLVPIVAVLLEAALFRVLPSALTLLGMLLACAGVALVSWRRV